MKNLLIVIILVVGCSMLGAQNKITLYDGGAHEYGRYPSKELRIDSSDVEGCISLHGQADFADRTSFVKYDVEENLEITFHTGDCNRGEGHVCISIITDDEKVGEIKLHTISGCNDALSAIYWKKR